MKKLRFEELPLEVKKDVFMQVISNKESPKETAKRYNITERIINKIVGEFIFENASRIDDGIMDITPREDYTTVNDIKKKK
jgi:hypothetical protein|tara:strand:+ start:202 stop:444 length:243 start_codon:yes stop_codon:yes gene_type:complete